MPKVPYQSDQAWLDEYSKPQKPMPRFKKPSTRDDAKMEDGVELWGREGSGSFGGRKGARQKRYIEGTGGMGVGK